MTKTAAAGPVLAGNPITYTITVSNAGPSDAQTVALSDIVPTNTTFVSDAQTSGPTFTLTSPAVGGTGTITGTIATLPSGDSASFTVVVLVSPSTPERVDDHQHGGRDRRHHRSQSRQQQPDRHDSHVHASRRTYR